RQAGQEYGYRLEEAVLLSTVGFNARDTETILKRRYGDEFPYRTIRERMFEYMLRAFHKEGIPVKKGLKELVAFLRERRVPLALATSSERRRATEYLKLAELTADFQAVVCGDEVTRGKPAPDIFLAAAQKLNAAPETVLVLEDSEAGIRAAAAARMIPVLVPDLKEPSADTVSLAFLSCVSLLDVRRFLEENPAVFS
ncbi:MAG TPA: HAD family phosphatase, partial [Spirochaetia bacterium]|nr:HAD family phosphatase [Spirochaetia bacterium]